MQFQDIGFGCMVVVDDDKEENMPEQVVGKIEQLTTNGMETLGDEWPEGCENIINHEKEQVTSDGITASYYELPPNAKEIQDLIAYKNMNSQMGEIFRGNYRYGECSHSDKLREINKILFYANAEKDRLLKYEI